MLYENIAVTGGNGVLGDAIVRNLMLDRRVTSLDISPAKTGTQFHHTDVLSLDGVRASLKGHDAIVHVAGLLLPEDPIEKMFQVNVVGTWNVCQAAAELNIKKLVLISSECSSGIINICGMRQPCPDYLPIDEEHPLRPLETYGMSKQLVELTAQSYARRGQMEVVALRPTFVLAPGKEDKVAALRMEDDPGLWSYVELHDVVQAARLALDYKGAEFSAFYLSARDTFSREPTLEFMERKFGRLPEIRSPEVYEADPFAAIWDLTRSEQHLGFAPKSDWRKFLSAKRDPKSRKI